MKMAEIININPTSSGHIHECRVIYGDTDSGGVVYYGNYLRYYEEGRTEFLRANGLTYRELEDKGFILPVVECYSRYKASAKYDDLIQVKTSISEVKKVSCRFDYRIEKKETSQLLVKGHTVNAVVNRAGKLTKMPQDVYELLVRLSKK
jgi:acyl-CoA thioester hydrolase